MTKDQLNALVQEAQTLNDLVTALQAAQNTTPQPGADLFTQAEADEVCKAVQALVNPTPATPADTTANADTNASATSTGETVA